MQGAEEMQERCLICEKPIYRASYKGGRRRIRGVHAVTCSHNCSKVYARVYAHIRTIQKMRKRKNG